MNLSPQPTSPLAARIRGCALAAVGIATLLAGCDESKAGKPPALMATSEMPAPTSVELVALAKLAPNRFTQVAATDRAIYVLQADPAPTAGLMQVVDGQVVPTALTSDAIARSMSLPKSRGQITAIAADGERVAFCFAGTNGTQPIAVLGTFNPVNGEIFTTVDAFALGRVDPEFISSSARPYLWVNGEVAWVVRVENAAMHLIAIRHLRALQPELSASRVELGSIQDAITRSAWDFSPGATPGSFYLTDTASRWIRSVDAGGRVHHVARFDESIASISPAANDAAGRVLVLASDREGVNSTLLVQNGEAFKSLPVGGFSASGMDLSALRIDRLTPIPGQTNTFVAYDGTSGTVLRVTLR